MNVNGKRAVVLGLGISGMEAAKLLKDQGAEVTVRDNAEGNATVSRRAEDLRSRGINVELGTGVQTATRFDFCVLSPGINPNAPLVQALRQAGLPMFGELEIAYRFCKCPIVAITGTNGKTTTTELVEAGHGGNRFAQLHPDPEPAQRLGALVHRGIARRVVPHRHLRALILK